MLVIYILSSVKSLVKSSKVTTGAHGFSLVGYFHLKKIFFSPRSHNKTFSAGGIVHSFWQSLQLNKL